MKKPKHLNKYNFDDFSEEYYLKTYLGSKVLVVYYNSSQDVVSVWLKGEIFIEKFCKVDLLASEDNIIKAAELLWEKTGGKSKKSSLKELMDNYVGVIPDLLRTPETPVWVTYRPSSTYHVDVMEE